MKKQKLEHAGKSISERVWYRIFICFSTLLFVPCAALYCGLAVISYGPSPAARDLFVVSMLETSALKFLPRIFWGPDAIRAIVEANAVAPPEGVSDTELIQVTPPEDMEEEIIIEDVKGYTFRGKMMIVADPSRLMVGISHNSFSKELRGLTVSEIISRHGGVGGVNAGGFADENGKGDGSVPLGIVISEGALKWGKKSAVYDIIGFDKENRLIVGKMTGKQALDMGVRDAVSFGPVLILNGTPMEVKGFGGGLNPRTAIGQRADGAVLLLVIDGRQPNSLGGAMSDVIDLMAQYGAVNAANLDGGSSTVMYRDGELINVCCSLYGPRDIPTALVVRNKADE
ncbi:MAG: phosphodiester glycosidase family protein [Synergistaceae bacterium]|jgi:exopolysaccharide biosynthesis protein|nr:phosphodiester glycosidase family protein [Synergistaceae bacterium]